MKLSAYVDASYGGEERCNRTKKEERRIQVGLNLY